MWQGDEPGPNAGVDGREWTRPGWFQEVCGWIEQALRDAGLGTVRDISQVRAWAPGLLAGYRSPFGSEVYIPGRNWTPEQARAAAARDGRGYEPGAEPVMFAGFEVSNSEVGDGAFGRFSTVC